MNLLQQACRWTATIHRNAKTQTRTQEHSRPFGRRWKKNGNLVTTVQLTWVSPCKLSDKSSEKQSQETCYSQSILHSHIGFALHICFAFCATPVQGQWPLCAIHSSTHVENHVQIILWICAGWVASPF